MTMIGRRSELFHKMLVFERLINAWAVKADDDGAVHVQNGDAGLAGFLDGGFGIVDIKVDVFVGVGNAHAVKVAHGLVAKCAPLCAINNNL